MHLPQISKMFYARPKIKAKLSQLPTRPRKGHGQKREREGEGAGEGEGAVAALIIQALWLHVYACAARTHTHTQTHRARCCRHTPVCLGATFEHFISASSRLNIWPTKCSQNGWPRHAECVQHRPTGSASVCVCICVCLCGACAAS